jgi:hypothetical protein
MIFWINLSSTWCNTFFFAGTKNKFDLSRYNWSYDIFLILSVHELVFVRWGSFQYYWCFGSSNLYVTLLSNLFFSFLGFIFLAYGLCDHAVTKFTLGGIKAWIHLSVYILLWFSFLLFRVLKLIISNLHLFLLNCGNNYSYKKNVILFFYCHYIYQ